MTRRLASTAAAALSLAEDSSRSQAFRRHFDIEVDRDWQGRDDLAQGKASVARQSPIQRLLQIIIAMT